MAACNGLPIESAAFQLLLFPPGFAALSALSVFNQGNSRFSTAGFGGGGASMTGDLFHLGRLFDIFFVDDAV